MNLRKILSSAVFAAAIAISGSAYAAEEAPMTLAGAKTIDAKEAKALFDKKVKFIDVREDAAWDQGRVPGAVHLDVNGPNFTKENLTKAVAVDKEIVVYCSGVKCTRSAKAIPQAISWGYKTVYYLREGFPGWKAGGFPTE